MKLRYLFIGMSMMLLAACTDKESMDNGQESELSAYPVLFSTGTDSGTPVSRASIVPYMQKEGKFICRMYYQGAANSTDYNSYTEAWLQVNNNVGNCVYRKSSYASPTDTDAYEFDREASIFYWQNRKPHIFIGLADYNKLTDETCSLTMNSDTIPFDLRRTTEMASVNDQLDPIQAHTVVTPSGATPEANRVRLIFKHCLSKVQVNLKPSVNGGLDNGRLTYENIDSVELLGISDTAYVYTIGVKDKTVFDTAYVAPSYKPINTADYTKEQKEENPYCTSIAMFKASENDVTPGYTSTFDVISFGLIQAIRITWHETNYPDLKHIITRTIKEPSEKTLKSGYQHIFNLELRRGTLAILNAEIKEWENGTTYDNIDGIIKKD